MPVLFPEKKVNPTTCLKHEPLVESILDVHALSHCRRALRTIIVADDRPTTAAKTAMIDSIDSKTDGVMSSSNYQTTQHVYYLPLTAAALAVCCWWSRH